MSTKRETSAASATILGALTTGAAAVMGVARSKVAALYLGPAGVGLIAEISQAVAIVAIAARAFTGPALMTALVETQNKEDGGTTTTLSIYRSAITSIIVVVFLGAPVTLALAWGPLSHVGRDRLVVLLLLSTAASLFAGISSVPTLVLIGVRKDLARVAVLSIAQVGIATLLVIAGTVWGGVEGNLLAVALAATAGFALFHRAARDSRGERLTFRPHLAPELWRRVATTGVAALAAMFGMQWVYTCARFAIEHHSGTAANGHFQAALAIATLAYTVFGATLNSHAFPRFAASTDATVALELHNNHRFLLGVSPAVALVVLVFGGTLTTSLYTSEFSPATQTLAFLVAGDLFRLMFDLHQGMLLFRGKTRPYVTIELSVALAHGVAMLIAVRAYGVVAVGPVYASAQALAFIVGSYVACRASKVRYSWRLWWWTILVGLSAVGIAMAHDIRITFVLALPILLSVWRFGGFDLLVALILRILRRGR